MGYKYLAATQRSYSLAALLQQFRYQASPSSLMTGAHPSSIVAMKVFMERNKIAPIRIGLKLFDSAEDRTPLIRISQEDVREALGYFTSHFPQRHHLPRSSGTFNFEIVAVIVMKLL